jgi:signal transduction histidine kinase
METQDKCARLEITRDVERAVSHFFAHGLNNALGAAQTYIELLAEDVNDANEANIEQDIQKLKRATNQAKAQVQVMRHVIPKHTDHDLGTSFVQAMDDVQTLIAPQGAHVDVLFSSSDAVVDAPVAIVTFALYHLVSHVIACAPGQPVHVRVDRGGDAVRITISALAKMEPLFWERPLWDDAVAAFSARVEPVVDHHGNGGFILHWPAISV